MTNPHNATDHPDNYWLGEALREVKEEIRGMRGQITDQGKDVSALGPMLTGIQNDIKDLKTDVRSVEGRVDHLETSRTASEAVNRYKVALWGAVVAGAAYLADKAFAIISSGA